MIELMNDKQSLFSYFDKKSFTVKKYLVFSEIFGNQ